MSEENQLKAVRLAPHLALTHELTQGAANGRNVSLLMKNKEDLTDEQKELLKSLSEAKVMQEDSKEAIEKTSKDSINLENGEGMTEQVNQDLTKALVDLQKAQEDLVKANESIAVLQKQVEDFEAAKVAAEVARREELIKGVQKDEEKAKELLKSLETLEAEAFDTVIKAMQEKVAVVENTDLFKQTSVTKAESKESTLAEMLKAKHGK